MAATVWQMYGSSSVQHFQGYWEGGSSPGGWLATALALAAATATAAATAAAMATAMAMAIAIATAIGQ